MENGVLLWFGNNPWILWVVIALAIVAIALSIIITSLQSEGDDDNDNDREQVSQKEVSSIERQDEDGEEARRKFFS